MKPKSEAQKARDRQNEKRRRLLRMEDPVYAAKIREQKRAYKAKRLKDPVYRARVAAWLRQDRAKDPERYLGYQAVYYEKKGITPSEKRRQWRAKNHDRYVAGYKESNKRRVSSIIASFRRGDITQHEFNRLIREFIIQNDEQRRG